MKNKRLHTKQDAEDVLNIIHQNISKNALSVGSEHDDDIIFKLKK